MIKNNQKIEFWQSQLELIMFCVGILSIYNPTEPPSWVQRRLFRLNTYSEACKAKIWLLEPDNKETKHTKPNTLVTSDEDRRIAA